MALSVIGTPIGDLNDLSLRAKNILQITDVIILEEIKEGTKLLRHHGIVGKNYEQLNEHTTDKDLKRLADICQHQSVALISDGGTPGFCDPGADLVALCRQRGILVKSIPGPSSLMALLSVCGQRLDQFYFRGFLAAKSVDRVMQLRALKEIHVPIILMDTPYRLIKLMTEMREYFSDRSLLLGLHLSLEEEKILEGTPQKILFHLEKMGIKKAEFILILFPFAVQRE